MGAGDDAVHLPAHRSGAYAGRGADHHDRAVGTRDIVGYHATGYRRTFHDIAAVNVGHRCVVGDRDDDLVRRSVAVSIGNLVREDIRDTVVAGRFGEGVCVSTIRMDDQIPMVRAAVHNSIGVSTSTSRRQQLPFCNRVTGTCSRAAL